MARLDVLKAFSARRLGGEPIPDDLKILLGHAEEFARRTSLALHGEEGWAPWLDTSYLTKEDRRDPDTMANVRAIADVCGFIAFVAANDDDECFGYWRGPDLRPIAESPIVHFDNEGQFYLVGGTFAEAILFQAGDGVQFAETREWLRSLGIEVPSETFEGLCDAIDERMKEEAEPRDLHWELQAQYRGKSPGA